MGDIKRAKTKWAQLAKRVGEFSGDELSSLSFAAAHPFVTKLDWSDLPAEDDPFRGSQMRVSVLMAILRRVVLPQLLPFLDTFEPGSELQSRPWLQALIASFYPLVSQCVEEGHADFLLKAEIANPVKQQLEVLRSTLDSIESPRGQVPGHEVPTLSTVANKADVTAFAYHKHRLVESKGLEEPMRRVTLIAQAKTDMRKENASKWQESGRYQLGDQLIQAAIWNAQQSFEKCLLFGIGTSIEQYAPSAFKLENLLKMENGSVVAVPQNPVYLSPDAPEVEQLLENAKARIALAVGTGKETIPDQIYAVGNFYTTVKVVTFLDLPREADGATDVREGALSLVQALSFILCGRMAKEWTPQDIEAALIAYEDAVAQKMRKFQLLPDSGESFEKDLDLFSN